MEEKKIQNNQSQWSEAVGSKDGKPGSDNSGNWNRDVGRWAFEWCSQAVTSSRDLYTPGIAVLRSFAHCSVLVNLDSSLFRAAVWGGCRVWWDGCEHGGQGLKLGTASPDAGPAFSRTLFSPDVGFSSQLGVGLL